MRVNRNEEKKKHLRRVKNQRTHEKWAEKKNDGKKNQQRLM